MPLHRPPPGLARNGRLRLSPVSGSVGQMKTDRGVRSIRSRAGSLAALSKVLDIPPNWLNTDACSRKGRIITDQAHCEFNSRPLELPVALRTDLSRKLAEGNILDVLW